MSRRDAERLQDVLAAADAIASHLARGDITDGLIFDAGSDLAPLIEAVRRLEQVLVSGRPGDRAPARRPR